MSGSSTHSIAQTYAQLLFELAKQQDSCQQLDSELEQLGDMLELERDFANMLGSPFGGADEKIAMAEKIFEGRISPLALGLFYALIRTNRLRTLRDVSSLYRELVDADSGRPTITVTLADDVNQDVKDKIEKQLASAAGKVVRVKYDIDPGIIGGIVIRHAGSYIDNSLLRVLEDAKKLLRSRMKA